MGREQSSIKIEPGLNVLNPKPKRTSRLEYYTSIYTLEVGDFCFGFFFGKLSLEHSDLDSFK